MLSGDKSGFFDNLKGLRAAFKESGILDKQQKQH